MIVENILLSLLNDTNLSSFLYQKDIAPLAPSLGAPLYDAGGKGRRGASGLLPQSENGGAAAA